MDRKRKMRGALVMAALLGTAALWGCERSEQGRTESANGNGAALDRVAGAEEDAVPSGVVELKPIDKAGLEKLLAETDAKVVLVDYWGSWCPSCMQKFPHTVELHDEYVDQGLKVVSLAVEYESETGPAAALEFLKKQNATFANFVADAKYEDFDAAIEAFDVGQFPTYRLFRKGGERIANFESGEGHEEIEAAIKKALEEQPAPSQQ
ncbi:MAG: TlpA disulfide reductase family protein [Planctomycetaceae bacterium]